MEEISKFYSELYAENKSSEETKKQFDLFADKLEFPNLKKQEKEICDRKIDDEEVARALKTLKNGSSPGSNGIPTEFYKFFWQKLKDPLTESFKYSFKMGYLSCSQRNGVISLLHKGNDTVTGGL